MDKELMEAILEAAKKAGATKAEACEAKTIEKNKSIPQSVLLAALIGKIMGGLKNDKKRSYLK